MPPESLTTAGYPLSQQQEAVWEASGSVESGCSARVVFELEGRIDVEALKTALLESCRVHETLRTGYPDAAGLKYPLQVIQEPAWAPEINEIDLSGMDIDAARSRFLGISADGGGSRLGLKVDIGVVSHSLCLVHCALSALAADHESLLILVEDIGRRYSGEESRQVVQYADYAQWQRELNASPESGPGQAFWKQRAGLMDDRGSDTSRGEAHARRSWRLNPDLARRLHEYAQGADTGWQNVLFAVWMAVVYRVCGDERSTGFVLEMDGRPYEELKSAIGCFARRLPLAVGVEPADTLAELVRRGGFEIEAAVRWQDCTGEGRIRAPGKFLATGRRPVGFSCRRRRPEGRYAGADCRLLEVSWPRSGCDLELECLSGDGSLDGNIWYDTGIIEQEVAERLAEVFVIALGLLVEAPDTPVVDVPMMGETEKRGIEALFDLTNRYDPSRYRCVLESILAAVRSAPGRTAVVHGDTELTYEELACRAAGIAAVLSEGGIGRGDLVGLCCRRTPDLVVGILGTMMAGAGYIPLDPAWPGSRIEGILEDSRATAVLSDRSVTLPLENGEVIFFDEQPSAAELDPGPLTYPDSADTAYVIYTSGTTGRPKGVVISHGNLSFSTWAREEYYGDPVEAFLLLSSHVFDSSVAGIFWTLTQGGRLVLPELEIAGTENLTRLIRQQEVTHTLLLPSLYDAILDDPSVTRPGSLSVVVVAGEACSSGLVEKHLKAGINARLYNEYGPSEATVWSTVHRACAAGSEIPIGAPIPGAAAHVLDQAGRPVPAGIAGEICIGGPGVTTGYLARTGELERRLLANPFRADGPVLYRTGDLGRITSNGEIEFLGRLDNQVKVRGYRVECEEVENVLSRCDAVRKVVVVSVPPPSGTSSQNTSSARLVSYFVPSASGDRNADSLRRHAASVLPEFMVPSVFISVDSMPLLSNGKIDRGELKKRALKSTENESHAGAFMTVTERLLRKVWIDVLGVSDIGPDDNFYELGGDSIHSIQAANRAAGYGIRFKAVDLFKYPSIRQLAASIAPRDQFENYPEPDGPVPLAPIQQWLLNNRTSGPNHRNMAVWLKCRRQVDFEDVCRAAEALVDHHDALRLRFERDDGGWRQYYAPREDSGPMLSTVDLAGYSDPDGEIARAVARTHRSLDITAGPVLQLVLFQAAQRAEQRIFLVVHHLVADLVSMQVLVDDLETACRQSESGGEVVLPLKTHSYRRWSQALEAFSRSEQALSELPWWTDKRRWSVGSLRTDRPDPDHKRFRSPRSSVRVELDDDIIPTTANGSRGEPETIIPNALLAAFSIALAEIAGSRCFTIDVEGDGRVDLNGSVDVSRTVGWFTSYFPFLVDTQQGVDFESMMKQIDRAYGMMVENGIAYTALRYMSRDPRVRKSLEGIPRSEIGYNYVGRDLRSGNSSLFVLDAADVGELRGPELSLDYTINLVAGIRGGRIYADFQYSEVVFDSETIYRIVATFRSVLNAHLREVDRSAEPLVLPLSPQQQGFLFHSLSNVWEDVYFTQSIRDIRGPLDKGFFQAAWQRVADRHEALRTSFGWRGLENPHQVVHQGVTHPFSFVDIQALDHDEQDRIIREYCETDRKKGFDLDVPPLSRVRVYGRGGSLSTVVWSCHHLVMDGWSSRVVLEEVLQIYDALVGRDTLDNPEPMQYSAYLDWLRRCDEREDAAFWRSTLAGVDVPTPLHFIKEDKGNRPERIMFSGVVDTGLHAGILDLARGCRVTANTVFHAAWAILLGYYSGRHEVVFGSTSSGRPEELNGIEEVVGLLITTLPVRIALDGAEVVASFLERLQGCLAEVRSRQHCALWQVRRWVNTGTPGKLFDSVVLFENFPAADKESESEGGLRMERVVTTARNNFPLTVRAVPGRRFNLDILYDRTRIETEAAEAIWQDIEWILAAMVETPVEPIGDLRGRLSSFILQRRGRREREMLASASKRLKRRTARGADAR